MGKNGNMAETDASDDDATLLVAYATVHERLYELLITLIDEAVLPSPLATGTPLADRLAERLANFALAAELDPTETAGNITGLGRWDHARAQSDAADILGNTLADLRDHLSLRGAK